MWYMCRYDPLRINDFLENWAPGQKIGEEEEAARLQKQSTFFHARRTSIEMKKLAKECNLGLMPMFSARALV